MIKASPEQRNVSGEFAVHTLPLGHVAIRAAVVAIRVPIGTCRQTLRGGKLVGNDEWQHKVSKVIHRER